MTMRPNPKRPGETIKCCDICGKADPGAWGDENLKMPEFPVGMDLCVKCMEAYSPKNFALQTDSDSARRGKWKTVSTHGTYEAAIKTATAYPPPVRIMRIEVCMMCRNKHVKGEPCPC